MAQTGIRERHARSCPSRTGASCRCKPTYEANVWSRRENKRLTKTFDTHSGAKAWRADASSALRKGTMRAPTKTTLLEAWDEWKVGAESGAIRTRSGDAFKPSAIRSYESSMRLRLLPDLDGARLTDITRADLLALRDRMQADKLDPSTIRNTFMPLRAIFREALERDEVSVNPTAGLRLPAVRGKRDRFASPDEASKLLAALTAEDRPLWATAFYAGLRAGELQALSVENVDLAAGVIRVEHAWDKQAGLIAPKSRAGRRNVPIPNVLREYLAQHKLRLGRHTGFMFGGASQPFSYWVTVERAAKVWKEAKLAPITLHECRHTFASLMIAATVNAKALSTYMGHSSVTITYDRYGHLMPGNEDEAAQLLDDYLEATVARSVAQQAQGR